MVARRGKPSGVSSGNSSEVSNEHAGEVKEGETKFMQAVQVPETSIRSILYFILVHLLPVFSSAKELCRAANRDGIESFAVMLKPVKHALGLRKVDSVQHSPSVKDKVLPTHKVPNSAYVHLPHPLARWQGY
jgi:hypothetical protein